MNYYIYKITNKINNKCYIGQSCKIRDRWVGHRRNAQRVKNGATLKDNGIQVIHLAMAKHGIENFDFKIIEEIDTQNDANNQETYWVSHYNSLNNGYNCTPGGYNAPKTEEWKAKVKATRIAKDNYKHSEETKRKISEEWHLYHSPESMKKCHDANRGRIPSKEQRRKVSMANKGKRFSLGHKQSKETIEKRIASRAASYGSKVCNAPNCDRTDGSKVYGVRYCSKHGQRIRRQLKKQSHDKNYRCD